MDNPEKLATQGTQNKEKQIKNIAQYVLNSNRGVYYNIQSEQ
jgi:hypothetical protein